MDALETPTTGRRSIPPHTVGRDSPAWFYVPLCSSTGRNARESTLTGVLFDWFEISPRNVAVMSGCRIHSLHRVVP